MKKKLVIIISSFIMIISLAVITTYSLLRDETNIITNTFTIGKVDIELDEADVDNLGEIIEGADRVIENKYHLLPGQTYIKDPTITVVKNSQDSYIRMIVTITHIAELKKIFNNEFNPETIINDYDTEKWIYEGYTDNQDNSYSYEFRYHKIAKGFKNEKSQDVKLEPLFKSFTIPGYLTGEQLSTIKDLKIKVVGHAIQAQGFDNQDAAWNAFKKISDEQ